MTNLILSDESCAIIGACHEVYRQMGAGFLESVYQECLAMEFSVRGIPFQQQVPVSLHYKNARLQQHFCPDFVCFDQIVVEIKAVRQTLDIHRAQILNVLKASKIKLGLLVNFCAVPKLEFERKVF